MARQNTVVFAFPPEAESRAKAIDVHRFLKTQVKLPAADVLCIQLDAAVKRFFVKLVSIEKCDEVISRQGGDYLFTFPEGQTVKLKARYASGLGRRVVRVYDIPVEAPNSDITKALAPYGNIESISLEKWAFEDLYKCPNGVRQVVMDLEKAIPCFVKIGDHGKVLVHHHQQPTTCAVCDGVGHMRSACPNRKRARGWETLPNRGNPPVHTVPAHQGTTVVLPVKGFPARPISVTGKGGPFKGGPKPGVLQSTLVAAQGSSGKADGSAPDASAVPLPLDTPPSSPSNATPTPTTTPPQGSPPIGGLGEVGTVVEAAAIASTSTAAALLQANETATPQPSLHLADEVQADKQSANEVTVNIPASSPPKHSATGEIIPCLNQEDTSTPGGHSLGTPPPNLVAASLVDTTGQSSMANQVSQSLTEHHVTPNLLASSQSLRTGITPALVDDSWAEEAESTTNMIQTESPFKDGPPIQSLKRQGDRSPSPNGHKKQVVDEEDVPLIDRFKAATS